MKREIERLLREILEHHPLFCEDEGGNEKTIKIYTPEFLRLSSLQKQEAVKEHNEAIKNIYEMINREIGSVEKAIEPLKRHVEYVLRQKLNK